MNLLSGELFGGRHDIVARCECGSPICGWQGPSSELVAIERKPSQAPADVRASTVRAARRLMHVAPRCAEWFLEFEPGCRLTNHER